MFVCVQVTKYHQFRVRRSRTNINEIWVQAREWPGASKDEPWSWKHSSDTHCIMFPHGVPDMLEACEHKLMPPMQRPLGQSTMSGDELAKEAEKIKKGTIPLGAY